MLWLHLTGGHMKHAALRWWNQLKYAAGGLHPFAIFVCFCASPRRGVQLWSQCWKSGEGWQQGRQAQLPNWGVVGVLGWIKQRRLLTVGRLLEFQNFIYSRGWFCVSVHKCGRACIFYTRPGLRAHHPWQYPARCPRYMAWMKRWKMY